MQLAVSGSALAGTYLLAAQFGQAGFNGQTGLVVDDNTGYAIYGYDPVAYFDQQEAVQGVAGMELRWRGAYWRFLHEGNRAAFKEAPEVYAPMFGGHDPLQLSRGYTVEGSPTVWSIASDRLFFFQSVVNLRIWETNPGRYLSEAEHNWQRLNIDGAGVSDPALNRLFNDR